MQDGFWRTGALTLLALGLGTGCAELKFREGYDAAGVTFFEPVPAYQISLDKDCKPTASVVMLPGKTRSVKVQPGFFGSSEMSVSFQSGMIASFGVKSDPQSDEFASVIAKAASLGGFSASAVPAAGPNCPAVIIFPIDASGKIDFRNVNFWSQQN